LETDEQLLHLLGIARRAGALALGTEAASQAVRRHRTRLILLAQGLSPRTAAKMRAEAEKTGVHTADIAVGMDSLEYALGKRVGVIAVNDAGFAKALLALVAEGRGGMTL
jgi:ribosomal protein L7Ae-like RNA K-turn-binding protein